MARRGPEQTASPQRNFTLTTAERLQAIVTGPPAYARRRKRIEDLSVQIVALHRAGKASAANKKLAELSKLVEAHNTYYPIEANLPLDPETSQLMELGVPWRPMPRPTIESLVGEAAQAESGPTSLAWSDTPEALSVTFDALDDKGRWKHFALRLDEEALSCVTGTGKRKCVPTHKIEEIAAAGLLEITTLDAETVRLPFRLDEGALSSLAQEFATRLRSMRAAAAGYRGVPAEE
jgi:hypothetical protein